MTPVRALLCLLALAGCSKAVDDYKQKSMATEAQVELMKLARGARAYMMERDGFPVGQAGPVPAASCCEQAGHKCQPDPKLWASPPWSDLAFDVLDPHYFRYTYSSDGKTFTATAIGDLDCDGETATFTVTGKLGDDTPPVVVKPAKLD